MLHRQLSPKIDPSVIGKQNIRQVEKATITLFPRLLVLGMIYMLRRRKNLLSKLKMTTVKVMFKKV